MAAEVTASGAVPDAAVIIAAAAHGLPHEALPSCEAALGDLVDAALVWGTGDARRSVQAVRDLVAEVPPPSGHGPGARRGRPARPGRRQRHPGGAERARVARAGARSPRRLVEPSARHPPQRRTVAAPNSPQPADVSTPTRPRTSLTIELAHAARLVADDHEDPPHWVPTDHYDAWLALHTVEQWTVLVTAWLRLPTSSSVADEKTQVLSAERDRRAIPVLRRQVLDLLASAPAGAWVAVDGLLSVLDDRQPGDQGSCAD